jgi:hypothetical protein
MLSRFLIGLFDLASLNRSPVVAKQAEAELAKRLRRAHIQRRNSLPPRETKHLRQRSVTRHN